MTQNLRGHFKHPQIKFSALRCIHFWRIPRQRLLCFWISVRNPLILMVNFIEDFPGINVFTISGSDLVNVTRPGIILFDLPISIEYGFSQIPQSCKTKMATGHIKIAAWRPPEHSNNIERLGVSLWNSKCIVEVFKSPCELLITTGLNPAPINCPAIPSRSGWFGPISCARFSIVNGLIPGRDNICNPKRAIGYRLLHKGEFRIQCRIVSEHNISLPGNRRR